MGGVGIASVVTPLGQPDVGVDAGSIVENVEENNDDAQQGSHSLKVGQEHIQLHLCSRHMHAGYFDC